MITRKIDKDDPQAGFAYNWVRKLGQRLDQLKVICLEKGNASGLSNNIEIFSLGKERGKNRLAEFINLQKGAIKFIRHVDGVFCHQNAEYIILISPYAKIFRKKIVSFYGHKAVNWKTKLIALLADVVVTSSRAGFNIDTPKKKVIGQGVDTELFRPDFTKKEKGVLKIISVGRYSPIKDYITLVRAVSLIKRQRDDVSLCVFGNITADEQEKYYNKIKGLVRELGLENNVLLSRGISQKELAGIYRSFDLAVNLCPTGAPDKAGFEAMASGLPLFTSNKSFEKDFGPYVNQLVFKEKDERDLADKIINLSEKRKMEEMGLFLRKQVIKKHNLDNLLDKILQCF